MEFLNWLQQSAFGTWARESDWGYPFILTLHAIGMGVVVGSVLMFDLRVLGYATQMPMKAFDRIHALAWTGFGVNAVSGVCLFASDPVTFTFSRPFQFKMTLIAAGGISAWVLGRQLKNPANLPADGRLGNGAKFTAAASSLFWLGAIVAGRLIAYIN